MTYTRPRLLAALAAATWIVIGAGAFQKLYVTIHFIDRATFFACWPECPPLPGFGVVWRSEDGMLVRRRELLVTAIRFRAASPKITEP